MSSIPGMIRILAVDDHALFRKGIAATIDAEPLRFPGLNVDRR